jgi:integrase
VLRVFRWDFQAPSKSKAFHPLADLQGGFPSCENSHFDATRPQKTWRTAWRNLTRAAGLKGFRFHNLRQQCFTELLQGGAPEAAVLSIAGHVSRKMMEHCRHIRMEAKRKALEGLTPVVAVESEFGAAEQRVH